MGSVLDSQMAQNRARRLHQAAANPSELQPGSADSPITPEASDQGSFDPQSPLPPPADESLPFPAPTPATPPQPPPPAAPQPAQAPVVDKVSISPANITFVSTAEEFQLACLTGAVDIEITAHLDLRELVRAVNPAIPGQESLGNPQKLALLYASKPLRSIRVRNRPHSKLLSCSHALSCTARLFLRPEARVSRSSCIYYLPLSVTSLCVIHSGVPLGGSCWQEGHFGEPLYVSDLARCMHAQSKAFCHSILCTWGESGEQLQPCMFSRRNPVCI